MEKSQMEMWSFWGRFSWKNEKELAKIRGKDIAMIFQDPMTSLNPTMQIGKQIMEPLMIHKKWIEKMPKEKP